MDQFTVVLDLKEEVSNLQVNEGWKWLSGFLASWGVVEQFGVLLEVGLLILLVVVIIVLCLPCLLRFLQGPCKSP